MEVSELKRRQRQKKAERDSSTDRERRERSEVEWQLEADSGCVGSLTNRKTLYLTCL